MSPLLSGPTGSCFVMHFAAHHYAPLRSICLFGILFAPSSVLQAVTPIPLLPVNPEVCWRFLSLKASLLLALRKAAPRGSRAQKKWLILLSNPVFLTFTSIVVLAITAGSLHGGVTARAPPAQLAYAIPAAVTQSAPTIAVAQTRAALCVTKNKKGTKEKVKIRSWVAGKKSRTCLFSNGFKSCKGYREGSAETNQQDTLFHKVSNIRQSDKCSFKSMHTFYYSRLCEPTQPGKEISNIHSHFVLFMCLFLSRNL